MEYVVSNCNRPDLKESFPVIRRKSTAVLGIPC